MWFLFYVCLLYKHRFCNEKNETFNKAFANSYVKYREKISGDHLVLLDK